MGDELSTEYEKAIGIFVACVRQATGAVPSAYDELLAESAPRRKAAMENVRRHFGSLAGPMRAQIMAEATDAARRQTAGYFAAIAARSDELTLDDLFGKA